MATLDPRTPILIGVGQVMARWTGQSVADAPSPLGLQVDAARLALADSGAAAALTALIDTVVVVRSNLDSIAGMRHPLGRCANPPGTLAAELGIAAARTIYSVVGGDQPQALVTQSADAIFAGDSRAVLIAGSEAIATLKLAAKRQITLDWSHSALESVDGSFEDRGLGSPLLSPYELANGLGAPTQTYPAFEHALRKRLGLDRAAHMAVMAELWEGFSAVAAQHPQAQFPEPRSREFLATAGDGNYPVADPYLKWHVAQDAVNQGAAVILTSVGAARAAGVDPDKWVFLHGAATFKDRLVSERADLSRSSAMTAALQAALAMAGKTASDMAYFDLYSCFPCAVLLASEALGIDWRTTCCTVTGGLPFFGGAGNNYAMHAIATMAGLVRAQRGAFGLVLANGGFLSKEAVGIYSTEPVSGWNPVDQAAAQQAIDTATAPTLLAQTTQAVIDTFTVTWNKGQPSRGYVIAANDAGRIIARTRTGDLATLHSLHAGDAIGKRVHITHENGVNFVERVTAGQRHPEWSET